MRCVMWRGISARPYLHLACGARARGRCASGPGASLPRSRANLPLSRAPIPILRSPRGAVGVLRRAVRPRHGGVVIVLDDAHHFGRRAAWRGRGFFQCCVPLPTGGARGSAKMAAIGLADGDADDVSSFLIFLPKSPRITRKPPPDASIRERPTSPTLVPFSTDSPTCAGPSACRTARRPYLTRRVGG